MKKIINKVRNFYIKSPDKACTCADCGRERNENTPSCEECGSSRRDLSIVIGSVIFDKGKIILTILLLFIISLGIFFSIISFSIFSKETLYWVFSAVLQAFTGLVAFLAAVIIFRLQNINNEVNTIIGRLREELVHFKGAPAYNYTPQEAISNSQGIRPEDLTSSQGEARRIQGLYLRHSVLKDSANSVKLSLKKSFLNNLIVITLSLVFLIFTEYIEKASLDIMTISIILVFCITALLSVKKMLYLIR